MKFGYGQLGRPYVGGRTPVFFPNSFSLVFSNCVRAFLSPNIFLFSTKYSMSDIALATANGQVEAVERLLADGGNPDALGPDGTSALCAAALWGNDELVKVLLKGKADVNVKNSGTGWTALHAAAFQEHGKVCHMLLLHGAKTNVADAGGCTPVDYASIAESIWPFFAAKGAVRTSKGDLVRKGIIRKAKEAEGADSGGIKQLSRPGSAYVRVQRNPFASPPREKSVSLASAASSSAGGRSGPGRPPVHP